MTGLVTEIHRSYHVPVSNTASAIMALENKTWSDKWLDRSLLTRI
jgi:hypothetical protein